MVRRRSMLAVRNNCIGLAASIEPDGRYDAYQWIWPSEAHLGKQRVNDATFEWGYLLDNEKSSNLWAGKQAREQIESMYQCIETLRKEVFPVNPELFYLMAMGPLEEIRALQKRLSVAVAKEQVDEE